MATSTTIKPTSICPIAARIWIGPEASAVCPLNWAMANLPRQRPKSHAAAEVSARNRPMFATNPEPMTLPAYCWEFGPRL